jgi:hypothetical protein
MHVLDIMNFIGYGGKSMVGSRIKYRVNFAFHSYDILPIKPVLAQWFSTENLN